MDYPGDKQQALVERSNQHGTRWSCRIDSGGDRD